MSNNWQRYFDQKAQTYGASVKASDYFDDASFFMQRDNILRWLGELRGKEILDAGCGVGAFSEPLTGQNTVYGVDFSEKSLEFAAARGLKVIPGDLMTLPFTDNKFDVVLCIGVIQLIEQYKPVIAELARVTRPGGILLVQTLHKRSLQRKVLGLFEPKKFDRMYDMDELKQSFTDCGLEAMEFLKMYHPFKFVSQSGDVGAWSDIFCTSFAIKGRKKIG
ncbi:class I SAM-dependent methyltransferase [Sporolituus thermophilus]|uniref:Methyltransferase domain-containing protein n=1 Tax=Sporolituus thermophilus DSM 23256 TaxID=1123285 RepID=A0A1G7JXX8_9FIRM|nr:class I SAM-dependent methyltransferase [Sporolituus thermophilus]SDF29817.1 Methyltransferase domain-containing protein [Sporolituus thermophilus DSM 23256]